MSDGILGGGGSTGERRNETAKSEGMVRGPGRDNLYWGGGVYAEEGISSQLRALSSPSSPMLLLL